jgi:hypothetical protein
VINLVSEILEWMETMLLEIIAMLDLVEVMVIWKVLYC